MEQKIFRITKFTNTQTGYLPPLWLKQQFGDDWVKDRGLSRAG